ncbi:hypothetical protein SAMN05660742_1182 [Propionispira arboris]|uniref:Uncharacterized protein n=1 Tax=Propionispira arboris TaxID=84035 RepID=A0A1H7BY44_9FIRM|nr:hypothetical protein [Propionispira arboris]SEJ81277.1 hypothetical protein SAMN05660742_1182 [Propionispira arboris]
MNKQLFHLNVIFKDYLESGYSSIPYSMREKFLALMLSDEDLEIMACHQLEVLEKYKEFQKKLFAKVTVSFRNDIAELQRSISTSLYSIQNELDKISTLFIDDPSYSTIQENADKIKDLLSHINQDIQNKKCNVFTDRTNKFKELLSLLNNIKKQPFKNQNDAIALSKVLKYKNELTALDSVKVSTSIPIKDICDKHLSRLKEVNVIYHEILSIQYLLYPCLNEEQIFALSFINANILSTSQYLSDLIKTRLSLYCRLHSCTLSLPSKRDLPFKLYQFNKTGAIINYTPLSYYTLRTIIKDYLANPQLTQTTDIFTNFTCDAIPLTSNLEQHLDTILSITAESYLFCDDIPLLTTKKTPVLNLDMIIAKLGIRKKELAMLLKTDISYFSRKNNGDCLWHNEIGQSCK